MEYHPEYDYTPNHDGVMAEDYDAYTRDVVVVSGIRDEVERFLAMATAYGLEISHICEPRIAEILATLNDAIEEGVAFTVNKRKRKQNGQGTDGYTRGLRSGEAWTEAEDEQLVKEYKEEKLKIAQIARNHERSAYAIRMRLEMHGLLEAKTN